MVSRNEDSILDQIKDKQIYSVLYYEDLFFKVIKENAYLKFYSALQGTYKIWFQYYCYVNMDFRIMV